MRSIDDCPAPARSAWHVSELPLDFVGREAVLVALDVVARELEPLAASFFRIAPDGTIDGAVVHGPRPAVVAWQAALREATPVHHCGGDDIRLLLSDGRRPVAGIELWRSPDSSAWTEAQVRLLGALGPLIELAYRSELRTDARLPSVLTHRQRQVARLLARGATNADVARALYLSPDTAKSHTRAVLAKLGVTSRRELAVRLTRGSSDALPLRAPALPAGGDATPRALLALVLEWATLRIGAAIGGCVLFSARMELVAQAWGVARGNALDPVHAYAVHRQLFPPSEPAEILRGGADPAVLQLDVGAPLAAELGLTTPLAVVLRAEGRVAGVIWLCGKAIDQRRAAQALRDLRPLLELAFAVPLSTAREPAVSFADLADRGLTPRELAVARLALAGRGNAAIAAELGVSGATVRNHMTRVLAKCGVRTRTQLIALFHQ